MSNFVYTPKGLININQVEMIKHKDKNIEQIVVDGEVVSDTIGFHETIISIIPVDGEWECIQECQEDDGSVSGHEELIIAWGLTVLGVTVPVTVLSPSGVHEPHAIRKKGKAEVYDSFAGVYSSLEDWLNRSALQKNKRVSCIK
jgi:hypothetical protein